MKVKSRPYAARRPVLSLPLLLLLLLVCGTAYLAYSLFASRPRPEVAAEGGVPAAEAREPLTALPEGVRSSDYWIRIDKGAFRLDYCRGVDVVASFSVALGSVTGNQERRGYCRTPEGLFEVEQIQNASWWTHDFGDGKGPIEGAYGPWFIRLRTGWKGIGIHGTHDPQSIGSLVTEGCIRLENENVQWLREHVEVGMKVLIEP